jgi:3-deoxy-manno-octulosonate cytidylyltransferase (CMP-KDO synthetase)
MADSAIVVIPARYGSTRLPGKALADIDGVPMIARVAERARGIAGVDAVLVATDDERVARAVEVAGGRAVMTRADHPSGTDRVAEVAARSGAAIVVNVQGDLPFLDPRMVEPMLGALRADPALPMATVMTPIRERAEIDDPAVVKVVTDRRGSALYFSRHPIPWGDGPWMRHVGVYVYRRAFLDAFARLAPTPLEQSERLEQLRALEHGHRIAAVSWTGAAVIEVNTAEELERARAIARADRAAAAAAPEARPAGGA